MASLARAGVVTALALGALPALGEPILSEVAWMGSVSSSADEFVEIHNPRGGGVVELSEYALVDNQGALPLPEGTLGPGETLVVEARPEATSLAPPTAVVADLALANGAGTELLLLCRIA